MPLELDARCVGVAKQEDLDVLSVGVAENPDGSGRSFVFQSGLEPIDSADIAESYSLVTEGGLTIDSGVTSLVLDEQSLCMSLSAAAARTLQTDRDLIIRLLVGAADVAALADGLARVFTTVDHDSRPRTLVIAGHSIAPKGRRKPKGERAEFRVIRERNGLAVSEAAGAAKPLRLPASYLAQRLGVEAGDLVGRRYTCLVVRDRWGMNLSGYRLL